MKKIIVVVLILIIATLGVGELIIAGSVAVEEPGIKTQEYAILLVSQGTKSDKKYVEMNFGARGLDTWKNNTVKTAQGKVIVFNDEVDILNYLSDQGWELVSTHAIVVKGVNIGKYILKRQH